MSSGRIQWKWQDISSALCLHASGPRAYRNLYKKGPLPHETTLQRWCRKVVIEEGVLQTSIEFMGQVTDLQEDEKLCVLSFDEMKVMEAYEYDNIKDVVKGPSSFVQVVMARGLKSSWKQPVFFSFDCQMTPDIIYSIATELFNKGFLVVATVCDMGTTNRSLYRKLGVTEGKYFCQIAKHRTPHYTAHH